MAVKREEGSSNNLRGDVLRVLGVLGVLKVATVEQIQQITAPHLSYRHTDKDKPSERKQARTASHTGALSDLRKHGLAKNGGRLPGGDTLRNLTPMGLKAAARELGRPVGEMGNPARGASRTGASHPMTVNEAVLALLRPKPDLARLASEPADVLAAAQAAIDAPAGLGTVASYATEVALPATGTWSNPGKGGAQADIVLHRPAASRATSTPTSITTFDVGLHQMTSSIRCVPHPALNVHPSHGCAPAGGVSRSARARPAARDSLVLRPTY